MSPLTASMAFRTPLPPKRLLSPSRSSTASRVPVEAPDGTAARPVAPLSRTTSTSTVGFPRLSRISRPRTLVIVVMTDPPLSVDFSDLRALVRNPFDPQEIGGAGKAGRQAGRYHDDFAGFGQSFACG